MRALPIIVDLFVLLTIFAFALFYAALGNSAPNEASGQLTMIEARLVFYGGEEGPVVASEAIVEVKAELIDREGNRLPQLPIEVFHPEDGVLRYLVRTAPEGALFRVIIVEMAAEAFLHTGVGMELRRFYPSPTQVSGGCYGEELAPGVCRIGQAPMLSMELGF